MPKLSIITINLNNVVGLQKTMESVFAQTFTDFEYIIIDGASTDGSKELIENNADKFVYWVSEKDEGIYNAMNKGIEQAKGKYAMFLNSGDYLLNNQVLLNAFGIIEKEWLDVYYGDIEIIFQNGQKYVQKHAPELDLDFLEKRTLNHQASFTKTLLFKELGLYSGRYTLAADYAFYLKAFIAGKKFKYIDQVMVHYLWNGITANNMDKYMLQMKEVWKDIVPPFLDTMFIENQEHKKDMKHKIVLAGFRINKLYQSAKRIFKKN